ncbi:MAG: MerR family transcriptional regulator [Chloracidobacterium sp.]|nr:MerR family transcriptional regulator [Chloracidobacterium sp.]
MTQRQHPAPSIPDKLFFKIGEVCELVGVQAHVLRYWETEFPTLQPQKNRSGQRTYRRKDVEMALRIKELLYEEGFTIAGAKRKLAGESRGGAMKLKIVPPGATASDFVSPPPTEPPQEPPVQPPTQTAASQTPPLASRSSRETIQRLRLLAEDLLTTLNRDDTN